MRTAGGRVTAFSAARGISRDQGNQCGADAMIESLFRCFRQVEGAPVDPAVGPGF